MHLKYNLFLEGWKSKYNSFVLDLEGYQSVTNNLRNFSSISRHKLCCNLNDRMIFFHTWSIIWQRLVEYRKSSEIWKLDSEWGEAKRQNWLAKWSKVGPEASLVNRWGEQTSEAFSPRSLGLTIDVKEDKHTWGTAEGTRTAKSWSVWRGVMFFSSEVQCDQKPRARSLKKKKPGFDNWLSINSTFKMRIFSRRLSICHRQCIYRNWITEWLKRENAHYYLDLLEGHLISEVFQSVCQPLKCTSKR